MSPLTTRRRVLSLLAAGGAASLLGIMRFPRGGFALPTMRTSDVFVVKNGTPEQNVARAVDMMGGIQTFVGPQDIVVLKPNAQWWNQGRTNLAAMKGFIDLVLGISGFQGEIIVGENHHFMDESLPEPDNIRGWTRKSTINGDIDGQPHTLASLVDLYRQKGRPNVTKSHWRDGGPKRDIWGNGQNGGIVRSAREGDGYVWADEDYTFRGFWGLKAWKVKMTYPVFTSAHSGITVDLRHGLFRRENGRLSPLTDRRLRFVNFPVLNDHGETGITGAVKNYMGVMDLSCGSWGLKPPGYVNVHQCGERFYPHAKAGPLGHFLKTVRAADLNIVTAEWVGWGHRTDPERATRMRTVLAGTDPIALDFYGARHLVYPLSGRREHNPEDPGSPVGRFLDLARESWGQGATSEQSIRVRQHDFSEA